MLKGINLSLLVGPAVAVPVPREVVDALTEVSVTTAAGATPSGFQLKFTLSNRSPLHTIFLLAGGAMPPILRVIIVATMNSTPHVLIDGVVGEVGVTPGESGHAVLTVSGTDLTAVMDFIDFSGIPYPALPSFARILFILAKYALLGIVPMVIPAIVTDFPLPTSYIPRHQGSDLDYIQWFAAKSGYVFYLDPGPVPGTSVAYWGPEIKVGVPQPALNINLDAHTNVETLNFTFDKEKNRMPIVFYHEEITKAVIPIPIPDITPLNPPLGLIRGLPLKFGPTEGEVTYTSPLRAVMSGLAEAARASEGVTANGTLDVLRYGGILKSRKLVGVRGAGPAFDGLYYVKSVTHTIKRGEYKQSFQLARNGLISTVAKVAA